MANINGWGRGTWGEGAWGEALSVTLTAPSAAIVLSVDDHGVIEFQLLFSRK